MPGIPGHQHIVNPDGTLGCGCKPLSEEDRLMVEECLRMAGL